MKDPLTCTITDVIPRTPTITSFRMTPDRPFDFLPGQFMKVHIAEGLWRYLSISSSPAKPYLEVTKRITGSDFSAALKRIKAGDRITVEGPLGKFVYKEEYQKIGFLIGGIGITPVMSILGYLADKGLAADCVLLYSNRTVEEVAFAAELESLSKQNPRIKIVNTITGEMPQGGGQLCGVIDREMVSQVLPDHHERIFFLCGPPKMVECTQALLLGLGQETEKIKTENFVGY
ncbi:MAG: xylene monooxygenase [Candidatus Omnitrophica bacterium]|nr:xylene monooxygenase [Candidatus Omnitrophota bacterium]